MVPVTAPGTEQNSHLAADARRTPDYVLLWGWGVMNSTALKEAQATGYPRDKMYGAWWGGAEPDVKDVGAGAKGYNALALNTAPTTQGDPGHPEARAAKGQGTGPKDEVGQRTVHPRRDHPDAEPRSRPPARRSASARAR